MRTSDITSEVIDALNTLRVATKYSSVPDSVKDAINILDNADVFSDIDEEAEYERPANVRPAPETRYGYTVGEYVIVSHPNPLTEENYLRGEDTFRVAGFTYNDFGAPLVQCADIRWPHHPPTVFYPHELSWEDGTRPTV